MENSMAIQLVSEEVERIRTVEGFSIQDDIFHYKNEELARAAAVYALPHPKNKYVQALFDLWPFSESWFKPHPCDRKKELIKAAALIVCEIEAIIEKKKQQTL